MVGALHWTVFALLAALALSVPAPNITRAATRCKQAGLFCLDCSTPGVCVLIAGQFQEYPLQTCTGVEQCSQSLSACHTKKSQCTSKEKRFLCQHQGTFPDPYDCNVYHECRSPSYTGEQDYAPYASHLCESGTSYNIATGTCNLPISYPTCGANAYPVEECLANAWNGKPFAQNPNYYWMCLNEDIRIYQCDEGFIFNAIHLKCVRDGEEPTEAPAPPDPSPICKDAGRQPDPASCYRYYDCKDVTSPVRVACPLGMYYHQRKHICLFGFCPY